jgi:excisionase family DNA binding protein
VCEDQQRLLTVADVTAWLQISRDWLYDEVEAGKFPVVRVGRRLRFRTTDIQQYLDGTWTPPRQRALETQRP